MKTVEDELFWIGLGILFLGLPLLLVYVFWGVNRFPMDCYLYSHFGVYCPGCGATRACKDLFTGHFLKSLWYHPVVLYSVFMYLGFMISNGCRLLHIKWVKAWKYHNWYFYVAIFLIFFSFIFKNVLKFLFTIEI